MSVSLLLLNKIVQFFFIMLMGFALVKSRLVNSRDSIILSKISIYILMPCTIINAFQIDMDDSIRTGLMFAFGAAFILNVFMIIIGLTTAKIFHFDSIEKASVIYSNAGNLVIPLVSSVLGSDLVIFASAYVTVQILFQMTHCVSLFQDNAKFDPKKFFTNINIISILVGFVLLVTGLRLPAIVNDTLSSMSSMLGPVSMVITGMLLGGMDLKKIFTNKRIYLVSFVRLILMPLLVLLLFKLTGAKWMIDNGENILMVSFLATITPTASLITQFAQLCGKNEDYAGAINIVTTVLCMITMPVMIVLYQMI